MPNKLETVPNQRIAVIHREKVTSEFLQIQKENLFNAYKTLNAHALVVYLYLAANKDTYSLAISPAAIHNATGMPESTCRDQLKRLIICGYLVQRSDGSNIYDFYEVPPTQKKEDHAAPTEAKKEEPKKFDF